MIYNTEIFEVSDVTEFRRALESLRGALTEAGGTEIRIYRCVDDPTKVLAAMYWPDAESCRALRATMRQRSSPPSDPRSRRISLRSYGKRSSPFPSASSRGQLAADFDDPAAAFRAIRQLVERVLDDQATPPDLANYLDLAVSFDLPQHGWDLANATLQDPTIDPEEVELLWSSLSRAPQVWDWQRENGWYAAPVSVPSNAPLQDRAVGLIGRNPGWTPET